MSSKNTTSIAILFGVIAVLLVATALALGQVNASNSNTSLIDWYRNGTFVGSQKGGNFTQGNGINITATNDPSNNRVNYTISATPDFDHVFVTSDFVKSNDTLETVPGFSYTLEPNSTYVGNAFIYFNSGAGGSKWRFQYSGTTLALRNGGSWNDSSVGTGNLDATLSNDTPGNRMSVYNFYIVTVSGGVLSFQFAQNSANAQESTLLHGSYLRIHKVN